MYTSFPLHVLDSLVARVRVAHSFALSPVKVNMPVWVMSEFVNWTVTPFRPFDIKGCYIPSRYSILDTVQVIYIFNRNWHTFSKWVWYAISISWMRVKILKFLSEVLKIATVLQSKVDRRCWQFNWESKNRLLRAFPKE